MGKVERRRWEGKRLERCVYNDVVSQGSLPTQADSLTLPAARPQQRKEATAAAERARFEEELKANGGNVDEAEEERQGMSLACDSLNVDLHEITPDGHCLYSAVADQLRLAGLGGYDYQGTRKVTAEYMRRHRDDFLPFISDIDESMAGIKNEGAGSASKDGAMEGTLRAMPLCYVIRR